MLGAEMFLLCQGLLSHLAKTTGGFRNCLQEHESNVVSHHQRPMLYKVVRVLTNDLWPGRLLIEKNTAAQFVSEVMTAREIDLVRQHTRRRHHRVILWPQKLFVLLVVPIHESLGRVPEAPSCGSRL